MQRKRPTGSTGPHGPAPDCTAEDRADAKKARSFIKPHFQNLASSGATLHGFTAESNREQGRAENTGPYPAMTSKTILLARSDRHAGTRLEWTMNGARRDRSFHPGELILNPAGLLTRPQWNQTVDLQVLAIDDTHLRDAEQFDTGRSIELRPRYGFHDPLLTGLLQAMTTELEMPAPDTLYTESLATAVAHHLLRHYAAGRRPSQPVAGRMSTAVLNRLHDYMLANLGKRITLAELAALAGVSASHFTRLFRLSTGLSPHQRLIALRLGRAEELLLHTALPIAEIATLTGFADQSHLTRLFRQRRGLTPRELRG